ncbi:inositol monophosphatase [Candidatus Dependentiae bacterium]|nr:inositol monophosphatase [Candidatus Dependentiae bacterium]
MSLSNIDVAKVVLIVQEVGNVVMTYFRTPIAVFQKGASIVTEVDLKSEQLLKEKLQQLLPNSGFIAEESGGDHQENEYVWVIDPLDGTKNFERGNPYFCVSVTLQYRQKPVLAVIYAPALQDLFYAQLGQGAWFNQKRLLLIDRDWSKTGIIAVTSYKLLTKKNRLAELKKGLVVPVGIRIGGAVALDLAYVAAGIFDVALFEYLSWWDIAAGILLIEQAGGYVGQWDGQSVDSESKSLLAGNTKIVSFVKTSDQS